MNKTKESILTAAISKLKDSGLGSVLVETLSDVLDLIEESSSAAGLIVEAETNRSVNGYLVPDLTVDQVTAIYNAVVAAKPVTVTDATGKFHLVVDQADSLNGELCIGMIYYDVMLLTYEISGNRVDISFTKLGSN